MTCELENVEMAEMLLQHGADINKRGFKGRYDIISFRKFYNQTIVVIQLHRTPLMVAAGKSIVPLSELLIKYNASLDLRSEFVDDFSGDKLEKVVIDVIDIGAT